MSKSFNLISRFCWRRSKKYKPNTKGINKMRDKCNNRYSK